MAEGLTLYAIEDDLNALVETLECVEDGQQDALLARIGEQLTTALEKRDRVAQFILHLEIQEEFAAMEISRLKARKDAIAAARERLEKYVLRVLNDRGVTRLEGNTCTLAAYKNPGAVTILDKDSIPAEFLEMKTESIVLKNLVKAALKAGRIVPGAELRTSERLEVR